MVVMFLCFLNFLLVGSRSRGLLQFRFYLGRIDGVVYFHIKGHIMYGCLSLWVKTDPSIKFSISLSPNGLALLMTIT